MNRTKRVPRNSTLRAECERTRVDHCMMPRLVPQILHPVPPILRGKTLEVLRTRTYCEVEEEQVQRGTIRSHSRKEQDGDEG